MTHHHELGMPFEEPADVHRALLMLVEDFGSLDWNLHRPDILDDSELQAVVEVSQNLQIAHAAMVLEWLRVRLPRFDDELRKHLFTPQTIEWQTDETKIESGLYSPAWPNAARF